MAEISIYNWQANKVARVDILIGQPQPMLSDHATTPGCQTQPNGRTFWNTYHLKFTIYIFNLQSTMVNVLLHVNKNGAKVTAHSQKAAQ